MPWMGSRTRSGDDGAVSANACTCGQPCAPPVSRSFWDPSRARLAVHALPRILSRAMIYDANTYWGRQGLERAILDALAAAGKEIDRLTVDDLAPADQFHSGGKNSTVRLARLASLKPVMRVLDVGGGLGGAARTPAPGVGCSGTPGGPPRTVRPTGGGL